MNSQTTSRTSFGFSTHGLPPREELLLKSIVRLLDHKTHQSWLYRPLAGPVRADLLVVAEGVMPLDDVSQDGSLQRVLTLGTSGAKREFFLAMPLRANELEAELNRLGGLIHASVTTGGQALALARPEEPDGFFRLLRWPPAALLATRERLRLATLMTGRAVTVTSLGKLSGVSLQTCAEFVDELRRAGLMQDLASTLPQAAHVAIPSAPKPPAAQTAGQPGLLSRIRQRLGIQRFGGA